MLIHETPLRSARWKDWAFSVRASFANGGTSAERSRTRSSMDSCDASGNLTWNNNAINSVLVMAFFAQVLSPTPFLARGNRHEDLFDISAHRSFVRSPGLLAELH